MSPLDELGDTNVDDIMLVLSSVRISHFGGHKLVFGLYWGGLAHIPTFYKTLKSTGELVWQITPLQLASTHHTTAQNNCEKIVSALT